MEKDETRKKTLDEKLATKSLPDTLKAINDRLAKTGSGFIAASGLSWADLHLFNVLEFLGDKKEPLLANFKHVKALDDKVRAHPSIAAYLSQRPKTEY